MGNEKEGQTVFSYKAPAIMITERNGDIEKVLEFATAEDYAAYKRIEAEALMTDKQRRDEAVKKTCEAAKSAIDEISKHTYWHAMCKQIKI